MLHNSKKIDKLIYIKLRVKMLTNTKVKLINSQVHPCTKIGMSIEEERYVTINF